MKENDEVVDLVFEEKIIDGTLYVSKYKLLESGKLISIKKNIIWSPELEDELKQMNYKRLTTYSGKPREMTK